MTNQSLLVSELKRYARMLVTDYPVSDALHDFVGAAAAILDIHGVGMSLVKEGRLSFATASLEDITAVEKAQEAEQAGPCVEAFRTASSVLIPDIAAHARAWPCVVRVAADKGIVAVGAIPLAVDSHHLLGHARTTADQLQEALDSRVVIEQAKGVIAGERGISVDEAFNVIRSHARKRGAPMRDVANAIVHLGLRP